ncbi:MAG: hypothetical protein GC150_07035 [Rhizobiales bacterium]|nr:hypothetical protein [Hyphomicrobiales bacterium]
MGVEQFDAASHAERERAQRDALRPLAGRPGRHTIACPRCGDGGAEVEVTPQPPHGIWYRLRCGSCSFNALVLEATGGPRTT